MGSERSNVVAVHDVSNPARPVYRQMLPSTNGPEGLLPVPKRNLLVVSSETDEPEAGVRASVQFYRFQPRGVARYPQLTSTRGIP